MTLDYGADYVDIDRWLDEDGVVRDGSGHAVDVAGTGAPLPAPDRDLMLDERPSVLAGVRDGSWLDAQSFPPLRYALPGVIPEGMTLLVGPPKAGKSWAALDVALAVAGGGRALGAVAVGAPRPVLLLALEDGDRRMQARCRALLGEGVAIPARLEYLTRLDGAVTDTVAAWLARHGEAAPLVVLDTLGRCLPPARPGESAYARDYRTGAALKALTDIYPGTALVVVHHSRKASSDDYVDLVSGTHGLAGSADSVIVLDRPRGEQGATLKITSRDVSEAHYALTLGAGGAWTLDGRTLDDAARRASQREATAGLGDRATEVYNVVARHPDNGIGPREVALAVDGIDADQAATYLGRLLKAGRLAKRGRGRYVPVPP